jgi:hypothetical protein
MFAQYQAGALDAPTWQRFLDRAVAGNLSYTNSRKWWEFYGQTFEPDLAKQINSILMNRPIEDHLDDIDAFE